MSNFTVIYDACVLYPSTLRDFLMHLALSGLYRARWSEMILDECFESILHSIPNIDPEKLERTRRLMNENNMDGVVCGFEDLIPSLSLPDSDDRHVLAAAIKCQASTIVTFNLKDFPAEAISKFGVEAQHPDEFIRHQLDISTPLVCKVAKAHRASLTRWPKTVDEYLDSLERQALPDSVKILREYKDLI